MDWRTKEEYSDEARRCLERDCTGAGPGRLTVACRQLGSLSSRAVDDEPDSPSRAAVRAAHAAPLWTATGRRRLVDVVPAHARRRAGLDVCPQLGLLPAQPRDLAPAADHRLVGGALPAAGAGRQADPARRR